MNERFLLPSIALTLLNLSMFSLCVKINGWIMDDLRGTSCINC